MQIGKWIMKTVNCSMIGLCKAFLLLSVGIVSSLLQPRAWADNCNNNRYHCLESFYRNQAVDANRRANAVSTPSSRSSNSSNSGGSYDGLSSALANSFAGLKARQDAAFAAGAARTRAWEESESRKKIVRFTDEELADINRNILIIGANDGRAQRQNQLGVALLEGLKGFRVDVEKGVFWLRKAAAQGDVNAMENLTEIFTEGKFGIKPDYLYGFQLYELLVSSSGMPEVERASMLMNQAIYIFKMDDSFYPQLVDVALKANGLGVQEAAKIIYKLTMVSSLTPTPVDANLKSFFEAPSKDPYIIAANGFAIGAGYFGISQDRKRGKEILQAEANSGHQPSIDILKIRDCMATKKTAEEKKECEPLYKPFFM
jgi:hypothetical protein